MAYLKNLFLKIRERYFLHLLLCGRYLQRWLLRTPVPVLYICYKLVLEKAEEPEIKLPTSARSSKKQESSRKTSLLSAIRVVSSAYLRLLICFPAILIPACASSSLAFCMMYSAYKLNKQGDSMQP